MANVINGANILEAIAEMLNDICKSEGGIRKNDDRIWEILHNLTEQEWDDIVTIMEVILKNSAGYYTPADVDVLQDTRKQLNKSILTGKSFVGRPLIPKSGNKYLAWRITMIMREVMNRVNDVYIPNRPGEIEDIKEIPTPKVNNYTELFE